MGPVLNIMAEAETAQISEDMTEWAKLKSALHAEAYQNFLTAEEKNNPETIVTGLTYTEEENDKWAVTRANVGDRYAKAQTEFCTGVLNPNNDADWNKYLQELKDLGIDDFRNLAQTAYDRG